GSANGYGGHASRLRRVLARHDAYDRRVPRELRDVVRVHAGLPRRRPRGVVGYAHAVSIDERMGLPPDGVLVRVVDDRARPAQYGLLHDRRRPGLYPRRAI